MLPFKEVFPDELEEFVLDKHYSGFCVYKVIFKEKDMVKSLLPEKKFDLQNYYSNPHEFKSIFDSYLPYITALINCIYWTPQYPKFVKVKDLEKLFKHSDQPRLRIIGDISCDIDGSIECTKQTTTPEVPTFVYDPVTDKIRLGYKGRGVLVMAIDNLPSEIPLESSVFFSNALKSFVPDIARADYNSEFSRCHLPGPIKKAVILYRGKLTPDYYYMRKYLG